MWYIYITVVYLYKFQITDDHTSHEKGALLKVDFYSDLKNKYLGNCFLCWILSIKLTLCDLTDNTVHGTLHDRILE